MLDVCTVSCGLIQLTCQLLLGQVAPAVISFSASLGESASISACKWGGRQQNNKSGEQMGNLGSAGPREWNEHRVADCVGVCARAETFHIPMQFSTAYSSCFFVTSSLLYFGRLGAEETGMCLRQGLVGVVFLALTNGRLDLKLLVIPAWQADEIWPTKRRNALRCEASKPTQHAPERLYVRIRLADVVVIRGIHLQHVNVHTGPSADAPLKFRGRE